MKKNKYIVPLILVFSLFFLWAISSNLLPCLLYTSDAADE